MTDVLVEGLVFPEGPRWHGDRLWFSDQHDLCVKSVGLDGNVRHELEVPGHPSGLGWLPDGSLLVVAMYDRQVLRVHAGATALYADLSAHSRFHCNDMVVSPAGRAYVGDFGFDLDAGAPPQPGCLVRIEPDRSMHIEADDLYFPNGAVITPDATTLIVAETTGGRLTAFTIAADGSLVDRRRFAQLAGLVPDGICLDESGAVWVASPISHAVVRVAEGGVELERVDIDPDRQPFACMLGGPDRRTLFACTAPTFQPAENVKLRQGRIEVTQVSVPGAGWP